MISKEYAPISIEEVELDRLKIHDLECISDYVRRDVFETVQHADTGHIGGSSSSVELLVALYFGGKFRFDVDNPDNPARDRVLIRGHEGPVRYPIFSLMGYMDKGELTTYRKFGSRLQGHEDMHLAPGVDITPSGSLGMLLSYGVGSACELINERSSSKVVVFLGDGEEQEGNISEAARHASTLPLDNLICIIDQNEKQLSRSTNQVDGATSLRAVWEGYGWNVIEILDGNNIEQVLEAYDKLQPITNPTCVVAHTLKGAGIEGSREHYSGYHTIGVTDKVALNNSIQQLNTLLGQSGEEHRVPLIARDRVASPLQQSEELQGSSGTPYDVKYHETGEVRDLDEVREGFYKDLGRQVLSIADSAPLYMISPDFVKEPSEDRLRFGDYSNIYHVGIREQHSIAMAHGISATNPDARIIVHYWDSFAFRAMDQINAAAQGKTSMLIAGANAGLFQERNGGTHQSVGQPGALLSIPGVSLYEPADARDLYNVFSSALTRNEGITYARLHSQAMRPVERNKGDEDNIDAYIAHTPDRTPDIVLASSGAFVQNCIEAARTLEFKYGVAASVLNIINQGSLPDTLPYFLTNDAPILTVYNGNPETLQSSIARAIMASEDMPRPRFIDGIGFRIGTTGGIDELEKHFGLNSTSIALRALSNIDKGTPR